jgi:hypothetical protein
VNNRGLSGNSTAPIQTSQQDTISQSDSGIEQSNSPSSTLLRRTLMNTRPTNNNTSVIHSNSANSLNDQHSSIDRHNPSEYLDGSLSSKQTKSLFEGIHDLQLDNNDSISEYQPLNYDSKSSDDRRSMSSPEKTRKQMISTKLFKPFQNMRFRKKNSTS